MGMRLTPIFGGACVHGGDGGGSLSQETGPLRQMGLNRAEEFRAGQQTGYGYGTGTVTTWKARVVGAVPITP